MNEQTATGASVTLQCTVTELFVHPIKGCRPVPVDSVDISPSGVLGDREMMVVKDGTAVNLKHLPGLAKISIDRNGDEDFRLSADGVEDFKLDRRGKGISLDAGFLFDQVTVTDQGDEVAAWISKVVAQEVRLVSLPEPFNRNLPVDLLKLVHGNPQDSFVDVAPIMLVNQSTLDDLNEKIADPVPVERFRPNIVVGGLDAYVEDQMTVISNEQCRFTHVTGCERCTIVNVDHVTGKVQGKEPLNKLSKYRRIKDGYDSGILFGNYFVVEGLGKLKVGDILDVVTLVGEHS